MDPQQGLDDFFVQQLARVEQRLTRIEQQHNRRRDTYMAGDNVPLLAEMACETRGDCPTHVLGTRRPGNGHV